MRIEIAAREGRGPRIGRYAASVAAALAMALSAIDAGPGAAEPVGVIETRTEFDVVIAGGTTAALAAAVAASDAGARVALLEPTDWPGGQLTASAVPAVDEAWHKIVDLNSKAVLLDVAAAARDPRNMSPLLRDMLVRSGDGGSGWVSRYCFEPLDLLNAEIEPLLAARSERLTVFRETVVKQVEADASSGEIRSLTAIVRTPTEACGWRGYDRRLSEDLDDWYDPRSSERFQKRVVRFQGEGDKDLAQGSKAAKAARPLVFLDATEWGEVLALADAPYLQGVEPHEGSVDCRDDCGQATVVDFVERYHAARVEEALPQAAADRFGFGQYCGRADAWNQIWTYRRIKGRTPQAAPGDLCLQNWGYAIKEDEGGNDYPFGYLFVTRKEAAAQRGDWRGGLDRQVLAAAEERAIGWHAWFKAHAPEGVDPRQIALAPGVLGTGHGLAKLPYIRDTRRSIGLDGFLLTYDDLTGPASQRTGRRFEDRIALGAYPADIHRLSGCDYPDYVLAAHDTLPFYVPLRALTNARYGNLLVAGKTMAQSFLANSATRLHPVEWSSGTAAGVVAAMMSRESWTSRDALEHVAEVQAAVREKTPIEWTSER